jgi:hypothetical protein
MVYILVIGLLLRVITACISLGFDHPNEVYRLLEPIADRMGFGTRLPWEWTQGLLSPIPVIFIDYLLRFIRLLGVNSILGELTFLRVLYGALGLLPIIATHQILKHLTVPKTLITLACWWMALWPEAVWHSVKLMDYSMESALLASCIIFLLKGRIRFAAVAFALLFFFRFQALIFLPPLIFLVLQFQGSRVALKFFVQSLIWIFNLAVLESLSTHSHLFSPFWKYIHFNVIQNGASAVYGSDPWHRYFSDAFKFLGYGAFLIFAPLVVVAFMKSKSFKSKAIYLLWLFPMIIYSLISHKEARFIWGFLWLIVPVGIFALSESKFLASQSRIRSNALLVALTLSLGLSFWRVQPRILMGASDVIAWSKAGENHRGLPRTQAPLKISGDPDFLPGGFFLRYPGPICYSNCPPNAVPLKLEESLLR